MDITPIPLPVPPPAPVTAPAPAPDKYANVRRVVTTNEQNQQSQPLMPGIVTMAKNLAYTSGAAITQAVIHPHQPILLSDEESNKRMGVCNTCEFLNTEHYRCAKCGCYMKAKVKVAAAKCPIGKW